MNGVTAIKSAFIPVRKFRRAHAGDRCTLCGLGIVAVDYALVELTLFGRDTTQPIHKQCTRLLWDMVDELEKEANADEAALADQVSDV